MRGWSRGPALCPRPSAESLRRGCVLSQLMPAAQRDERRRPCRAIDRSRGACGTALVAGLTQEFRRDHFEVARRDLLVALCRSGHRTRSSAHVWTCSAPRDRPPCWIRAQLIAPGSLHAIRVRHSVGPSSRHALSAATASEEQSGDRRSVLQRRARHRWPARRCLASDMSTYSPVEAFRPMRKRVKRGHLQARC